MVENHSRRFRFSLRSVFVLILGIAIGYSLNIRTLELLLGVGTEGFMASLPTYLIEPPDVLEIDVFSSGESKPSVDGQYMVLPDGTVNLGTIGSVVLAGKTIDEARNAIARAASLQIESPQVDLEVVGPNSKVYYVVTKGTPFGDTVARFPITGNDTALDAIAQIGGPLQSESIEMWIARPSTRNGATILPIDWQQIAESASTRTNYQLFPGDRLVVAHKSR